MIHIEQYQKVSGKDDLQVVAPTGDYNEEDLLECALTSNLSNPICMLQAQYVAFGSMVYQQDEVLSDAQVSALLSGEQVEDVIGNEDLIEEKVISQIKDEPKTVTSQTITESIPTPEPITPPEPVVEPEPVAEPTPEPTPTPEPVPETESTIEAGEIITPENIDEIAPLESPVTMITKKPRLARNVTKRKVA